MHSTHACIGRNNFRFIIHPSSAVAPLVLFILISSGLSASAISLSASRLAAAKTKYRLSGERWIFAPIAIRTNRKFGTFVDHDIFVNRRRNLLEENATSTNQNPKPLQERNDRIDPLNGLKKYRGGYDLKSKHYWASVAFTGIYGYAIGAALLLLGLVLLSVLFIFWCRRFSSRWKRDDTPIVTSSWILISVICFLIIASLVFCCVALVGNKRINYELKHVESTITDSADNATTTIYNVTSAVTEIGKILLAYDQGSSLLFFNSTSEMLNSEANNVKHKVSDNTKRIDPILSAVYITVLVLTCVTILNLVFTAVCTLLHRKWHYWRRFLQVSLVVLWIITVISWFIFGGFYMVHSFVDDSCIALLEYQNDPYNSSLDTIIPCIDLRTANHAVIQVRGGMYDFISQANYNISMLQQDFNNNKQIRSLPHICNPFSGPPDYKRDVDCLNNTVSIGDVPTVLQPFKCSRNDSQECVSSEGKYITNANFNEIIAFTSAAQRLIDITPSLETLTNCSFVEDAFTIIVNERCNPVKSATHIMWAAYVGLCTTLVLLLMFSIIELYNTRQPYSYVKGIVVPHNALPPPNDVGDVHD